MSNGPIPRSQSLTACGPTISTLPYLSTTTDGCDLLGTQYNFLYTSKQQLSHSVGTRHILLEHDIQPPSDQSTGTWWTSVALSTKLMYALIRKPNMFQHLAAKHRADKGWPLCIRCVVFNNCAMRFTRH